jgi:hypothetical protein
MSKANRRNINCYHESGHAFKAWLEGVTIAEIRLVPECEPGQHAAITWMKSPGANPENWTLENIISQMRITMAGPEADKRGLSPVTGSERQFAAWEFEQHQLESMQYAKQFGAGRIQHDAIPTLAASAEQDVVEVFKYACVTRCVEALAQELLRRERIAGPDAEAFISSRINQEQRLALRRECSLTRAETMQNESPAV